MGMTRKRLVGPVQIATGPATVYTVPAVTKTTVRHIHVYNPGGGTVKLTMSIGADAAGTRVFDAFPVAEDVPFDHYGIYHLSATEVIQLAADVNNQLVIVIDGEEYTL